MALARFAIVGVALILIGCGGDPQSAPSPTVARVGDQPISAADLRGALERTYPIAPGASAADRARARAFVLGALIKQRWISMEARARDVELPADGRERSADREAELLRRRMVDAELADDGALSEAALRRYFERHRSNYEIPERRDMRVVVLRTRREGDRERARLLEGDSWGQVWKRSLHDVAGGTQPTFALVRGEGEPPLDRALFKAKMGALTGPIETTSGWYVFEVVRIVAGSPNSFEPSRSRVAGAIRQAAESRFDRRLREKYESRTSCRVGLTVPACGSR